MTVGNSTTEVGVGKTNAPGIINNQKVFGAVSSKREKILEENVRQTSDKQISITNQ